MRKLLAVMLAAAFVLAVVASQGLAAHTFHSDRSGSTIIAL
jgi:hypothetical protein